jgi:hypothetical protein
MKTTFLALAAIAIALIAAPAQASGGLYLTSDYHHADTANAADVTFDGDGSGLSILQSFDGRGGPNSLGVNIVGDLDGGPLHAAFDMPLAPSGLLPGQLSQTGHDNVMTVIVSGSQNFFAATQVGSHNLLTAMITGHNNQAAVSQAGSGNTLSFTQNGNGNRLTVIQRSY